MFLSVAASSRKGALHLGFGVLGFWGFGVLGFWGFGVLGFWGLGLGL
eukprot:gene12002-5402_t